MKNKSAQVTIFIILAILIVSVIIVFFVYPVFFPADSTKNPEQYLKDCAKNSLEISEKNLFDSNILIKGNFSDYMLYQSRKVPYICSTSEFYIPCIPQQPGLLSEVSQTIDNKLSRDLNVCFESLSDSFEKQGYYLKNKSFSVTSVLVSGKIKVNIDSNLILERGKETATVGKTYLEYNSPLFDLIKLMQIITNYESVACEFNDLNWMRFDSSIIISRFRASDQTKVYTISDRNTNKQLNFAIKTCVLPAGL
jgi:hypothetical protein